jgi:fatty acid-binding protein DegV
MVDYGRQSHDSGARGWCAQHINAPDEHARLVERGREIFGSEPKISSQIGPVLATHTGPGLLGIGGLPLEYL